MTQAPDTSMVAMAEPSRGLGSELDALPDEDMERDQSFDEYVDHMSDSVHFDLGDIEEEGSGEDEAPAEKKHGSRGGTIRDDQWTPKRSFLAESPYFSAFVEKEMHEISVVTEILNDISDRTRTFTKYGALMAEATHSLSLSCRLRREQASQEDIKISPRHLDYELEKRRQALGPEMSDLLGIMGEASSTAHCAF